MSEWPKDELRRFAETDDLHIAPLREDGVTYGTPTWIWSVVVEDGLYVRAYNGPASSWYRAAIKQHTGRIIVAGMTKDVNFLPVESEHNADIDEAYGAKYKNSPYLKPMVGEPARSATVRIEPR